MRYFSLITSGLSLLAGLYAFAAFILGYYRSLSLPDIPRPNVGPGFSEAATAYFGGAALGFGAAAVGVALGVVALLFGGRSRFKYIAPIPAATFFLVAIIYVLGGEYFRTHGR